MIEGLRLLKRQRGGNLWYFRWDPGEGDYSFLTIEDLIADFERSDEENRLAGYGEYPFVLDGENGEIGELDHAGKAWEKYTTLFRAFKSWEAVAESHAELDKDCDYYAEDRARFLREKRNHARRERRRALAAA